MLQILILFGRGVIVQKQFFVFFFVLYFVFFGLISPSYSSQVISIDTPYMEYDWKEDKIIAKDEFKLSYLGYNLSGDELFLDIDKGYGTIKRATYIDENARYTGDVYFRKDFLKISNAKFYKDDILHFGAKKISIYPEHFISLHNVTLYNAKGIAIFGFPYYGRLLSFPEYESFPKITISSSRIKINSYLNYYSDPSSFGTFLLSYDTKSGASIRWEHFFTEDFAIFYDYNFGDSFYGLYFNAPISLRISSDLKARISYNSFKDSFLQDIYLDYDYNLQDVLMGADLTLFSSSSWDLYSHIEYDLSHGECSSFKIGISPFVSPFRIDIDYDFLKRETGIWFHLDM